MTTREELVKNLIDSELMTASTLQEFIRGIPASDRPTNGESLARSLVNKGLLTRYQADAVLERQFGRLSIGQYEVLEQIGAGGMGAVYKARHRRMNRTVAIKMITQRHENSAGLVKRFEREVQVISGLQHANIVLAHDADECEAGPFLVMEYVAGDNLDVIVRNSGPLTVAEAIDCTLQSARGLEYAHAGGVIHRDIKPANLLRVERTGCIKIADLGLARFKDDQDLSTDEDTSLTATGNILGTVLFMAPEQSVDTKSTDRRCDIYSLGCTLFFLLHGRPPFVGESTVDTVMLHRRGAIPALRAGRPDVPESLERVYQRMVAKSPDDRFQSMTDVIAGLGLCEIDPECASQSRRAATSPAASTAAVTTIFQASEPTTLKASVVLVEPSGAQALLIRGFLESLGITGTQRCRTGAETIQTLSLFSADLVISAMHLDDMTGLQLAQRLFADVHQKRVGFILISSSSDARQVLEGQERGLGITLLAKPFDEGQLAEALREAITASPRPK